MPERLGVGLVLHPNREYLQQTARLIEEEADFFEVSPETLWSYDPETGAFGPNAAYRTMLQIRERSGRRFVAHGLSLSVGTPGEEGRLERWARRLAEDQTDFDFAWFTEHLGWVAAGGLEGVLPMPLPHTEEAVATVAERLGRLRGIFPEVGFENQAWYFSLSDPRTQPEFFNALCRRGLKLLLDLHNAYTECLNHSLDFDAYLDAIDLDHVIEIHLSGGSQSEPEWVESGRVFRLDTHDGPVPEPVWKAFERVAPKCRNLRGVVLERLDGTMTDAQIPAFEAEFSRLKEIYAAS